MRRLRPFLATYPAAVMLVAAHAEDTSTTQRQAEALTKGVPAADRLPPSPELDAAAERASALLTAGACGEGAAALETLCTGLIRPEAARSQAVCYARVAELAGACSAETPR